MVHYLKNGKGATKGFGKMPFNEITKKGLLPLLKPLNHPSRIRLLSTARWLVEYAKVHDDWPEDRPSPFDKIDWSKGFADHKQTHRPAIIEPVPFGALLRKIRAYESPGDGLTGYALELLALTFVRAGTVTSAKWADFDLKRGIWTIPFAELKMATKREEAGEAREDFIVPLSRQAVVLLRELHKITGNDVYLFPGRGARPMSRNTLNFALCSLGYKGIHCAMASGHRPRPYSIKSAFR